MRTLDQDIEWVLRLAKHTAGAGPMDGNPEAAIERVRVYLGNMRWIPCAERMPEEGRNVLLWNGAAHEVGCLNLSIPNKPFYHAGYEREKAEYYTHWMPLPEGPEVKG